MPDALRVALDFCAYLSENFPHAYRLSVSRPEALMVELSHPGQRWEIEFFADGSVETETFVSTAGVEEITVDAVKRELEPWK